MSMAVTLEWVFLSSLLSFLFDSMPQTSLGEETWTAVARGIEIYYQVEILCPLTDTGSEVAAVARGDLEATRGVTLAGSWSARWLVQWTADQCY